MYVRHINVAIYDVNKCLALCFVFEYIDYFNIEWLVDTFNPKQRWKASFSRVTTGGLGIKPSSLRLGADHPASVYPVGPRAGLSAACLVWAGITRPSHYLRCFIYNSGAPLVNDARLPITPALLSPNNRINDISVRCHGDRVRVFNS